MTPPLRDAQLQRSQQQSFSPILTLPRLVQRGIKQMIDAVPWHSKGICLLFQYFLILLRNKRVFQTLCIERNPLPVADHKRLHHRLLRETKSIYIRLPSLLATNTSSQIPACSIHCASSTETITSSIPRIWPPGPCWKLPISLGPSKLQQGRPQHSNKRTENMPR